MGVARREEKGSNCNRILWQTSHELKRISKYFVRVSSSKKLAHAIKDITVEFRSTLGVYTNFRKNHAKFYRSCLLISPHIYTYIQRQYFYIVAFYYNIYVPNNQLYTILLLFHHRLFAQSFSIIVPSYKYKIQNVVKSCFIEI